MQGDQQDGFHKVQAFCVVADQLEVFQAVGNDAVAHVRFDVENADDHTQRFCPTRAKRYRGLR